MRQMEALKGGAGLLFQALCWREYVRQMEALRARVGSVVLGDGWRE
jgi:hypothetical protein